MELKDMIYTRRSVRKFADEPLQEQELMRIRQVFSQMKPLYPTIRIRWEILEKEQARLYLPWKAPYLIAIYSEKEEGYCENVGFLFQQMDLYLQSIGLGSCWVGLGKPRLISQEDGMEFVVLLAFGRAPGVALRAKPEDFRRKSLAEIADTQDDRLEPARLAPSSTNSQPWFFTHEEDAIHAWCSQAGLFKHAMLGTMNRIDMGIALAHLYVANPDSFRFFLTQQPKRDGYRYMGSFTL